MPALRLSIMNPSKASALDSITPRHLRLLGEVTTQGLFTVIKRILDESIVPTHWKISRMHTIYKKGYASDRENHRPIQMLSVPG